MTQPPRQFSLKDRAPTAIAYGSACRQQTRSARPTTATFGPEARSLSGIGERSPFPKRASTPMASTGGEEILPEEGFEQQAAAREWLKHLEAGHFG